MNNYWFINGNKGWKRWKNLAWLVYEKKGSFAESVGKKDKKNSQNLKTIVDSDVLWITEKLLSTSLG